MANAAAYYDAGVIDFDFTSYTILTNNREYSWLYYIYGYDTVTGEGSFIPAYLTNYTTSGSGSDRKLAHAYFKTMVPNNGHKWIVWGTIELLISHSWTDIDAHQYYELSSMHMAVPGFSVITPGGDADIGETGGGAAPALEISWLNGATITQAGGSQTLIISASSGADLQYRINSGGWTDLPAGTTQYTFSLSGTYSTVFIKASSGEAETIKSQGIFVR
jgi:hypothetical protein